MSKRNKKSTTVVEQVEMDTPIHDENDIHVVEETDINLEEFDVLPTYNDMLPTEGTHNENIVFDDDDIMFESNPSVPNNTVFNIDPTLKSELINALKVKYNLTGKADMSMFKKVGNAISGIIIFNKVKYKVYKFNNRIVTFKEKIR